MRHMRNRWLRRVGLLLLIAIPAIGVIAWHWLIPAAIVAAIRERHEGYVAIAGWWIDGSSAGVTGLALHEQPSPDSPTWAAVDRVATDLSIVALLHGRVTPRRIEFDRPSISFRIARDGNALTKIPMKQSGEGQVPAMTIRDGTLAMRQEGRDEMVVRHLGGELSPDPGGPRYAMKADDAEWGHPSVEGRIAPDFSGYELHLKADHLPTGPEKARRVPFVADSVWTFIEPRGPIGVGLDFAYRQDDPSSGVMTTVNFEGTTVWLPTLGLLGEGATGRLTIRDQVVALDGLKGRMCGGRVAFSGPLDFRSEPDRYDLALQLEGVDLAALPASWQLQRLGVRGRFTGTAGLRLVLTRDGIDMTGTIGEGVVDGAEIRGIPLKRLDLTLRGEGLRPGDNRGGGEKEGPFLPQWVRGTFRVKDVALDRTLAHVETPKHPEDSRTLPVSGRLGLAAEVRFPLGSLEDWKAYTANGGADIGGAQIGGLDLGRLRGRLELSDGILQVADLCGRVLDRPGGSGPPPETEPPPPTGPLPRGGFRGRIRAELVGDQDLRVEVQANELPLAELAAAAPTLSSGSRPASQSPPEPLPISGRITFHASGRSRGPRPTDPRSWTASGRAEMPEVAYKKTVVRDVRSGLSIEGGRLVLPDLAGRLGDASFRGRLGLDLSGPYAYDGVLETGDLPCRELVGLASGASASTQSKVKGTIAGRGEAQGTLKPWMIRSTGLAKVVGLEYGRATIGDVPVRWTTPPESETIVVTAEEQQRYGGKVSAVARVPIQAGRPIEGTVTLSGVDAAEVSKDVDAGDTWKLTGRADGQGRFKYDPGARTSDAETLPLEAEAKLTAPDLKVGGVPARSARLSLTMHDGKPRFEMAAEGLGGTVRLTGDGRLANDPGADELRAQLEAMGVELFELWAAMGTSGALADLRGKASIRGRGEARGALDLDHARAEGTVELQEVIWGYDYRLGDKISTRLSKAPDGWRVGPLGGDLFGGKLRGDGVWMYRGDGGRPQYGADVRVERLMLNKALRFLPEADRRLGGSGTLRIAGRTDGSQSGTIELRVDRGQVNGLQLSELHVPAEWKLSPNGPRRGSVHVQRADGRLAGGRVGGEAHFSLGDRRDFHARLTVDDVDLRVISREEMSSRPMPGNISGFVSVYGTDPSNPTSYRGELDFDLDQASLVDIPLLDELDRSLGSTGGGVFDDGDIHATIIDRRIVIDNLTLVGPLAQVHAQGTVDFDGRLNLEVVVNNNKGVYQSGQAILSRAPNVANEVARRASQIDQVRDFVSSKLMKFRITGTVRDPVANVDRSINPTAALGFFLKTMRLSAQAR